MSCLEAPAMQVTLRPVRMHSICATSLALLVIAPLISAGQQPQGKPSRIIRTKRGRIQGIEVHNGPRLPPIEAYLGLPYAAPPTRFMPPTSPSTWQGVRSGRKFRAVCPQQLPNLDNRTAALETMPLSKYQRLLRMREFLKDQSEDCLFLNIYTPATGEKARARYPVMVYVHGESFGYGSGNSFDGSVLASFGAVVVVTINYRLGVLGFLNSNFEPVRAVANYGLLDIVAALEFIRLTVAAFGGDPTNVTVFGHGAGAACVNHLMTSASAPLGLLFHRVILMSGSSLAPWALLSNPLNATRQLARHTNCSPSQSTFLPCLRSKPLTDILAAPITGPRFLPTFGPSLDGIVISDEFFMSRASYVHRLVSYSLMAGVTPADAADQLSERQLTAGVTSAERDQILRTYTQNSYSFHLNELVSVIRHDYTDWTRGRPQPRRVRDELVRALGDAQFVAPMAQTASLFPDDRGTYLYVFGGHGSQASALEPEEGHGSELPYVFGAPLVYRIGHFTSQWSNDARKRSEAVMTYWTNFAKTGDPNKPKEVYISGSGGERFRKITWSPYDNHYKKYLSLGSSPRILGHYRSQRVALWLHLLPEIHRRGDTGSPDSVHHTFDTEQHPHLYLGSVRSVGATWRPLPATTTTGSTDTNASAVLDGSISVSGGATVAPSASKDVATDKHVGGDSGTGHFSAYSTALSVTVAIGCSLLVLNILILAGVYYQREKGREEARKHVRENGCPGGGGSDGNETRSASAASAETCSLKLDVRQTTLPPPQFADLPPPALLEGVCSRQQQQQVPRPPPPPCGGRPPDTTPLVQRSGYVSTTLPRNMSRGSLRQVSGSHSRCSSHEHLSELRV